MCQYGCPEQEIERECVFSNEGMFVISWREDTTDGSRLCSQVVRAVWFCVLLRFHESTLVGLPDQQCIISSHLISFSLSLLPLPPPPSLSVSLSLFLSLSLPLSLSFSLSLSLSLSLCLCLCTTQVGTHAVSSTASCKRSASTALAEPTMQSLHTHVRDVYLFQSLAPLYYRWSDLAIPNLTGSVTLTPLAVISCITNTVSQFFGGTQAQLAETPPQRLVGGFMRLFFKK